MKILWIGIVIVALNVAATAPVNTTVQTAGASVFPPMHSVQRAVIEAERLGNSEYCGHCHTDIFHQWNASAHHFSSFNNPVYRRVALATASRRGPQTLKFCARCHDPLPLLAGEVPPETLNRWAPNAGLTCLACHRITRIHGANGSYDIEQPFLHPFALSDHPALQRLHGWLVGVTPDLHRAVLSKPFYESPQYCATCHTVVIPAAVNGAQDLTLQDELGQWQRSHYAAHDGTAGSKACIDCHMPRVPSNDPAAKDGLIRSHRFTGGNTLLPTINRDADQLQATHQFLRDNVVQLSCSVSRSGNRGDAPLPCERPAVEAGDELELHIDITNTGAGHDFPGGTSDSNEAWLEVIVVDAAGARLLHSGQRDERGDVDASAHFLQTVFADKRGARLDRRNTTTEAASVLTSSVIPAGDTRRATYVIEIPTDAILPLTITARLNWRKYPQSFLRWVFENRPAPNAPVTTMTELNVQLDAAAD